MTPALLHKPKLEWFSAPTAAEQIFRLIYSAYIMYIITLLYWLHPSPEVQQTDSVGGRTSEGADDQLAALASRQPLPVSPLSGSPPSSSVARPLCREKTEMEKCCSVPQISGDQTPEPSSRAALYNPS
ncbi:unnamed protein product [Pleuronectes platessa]|uniref:Uncharacterized protein n=1 Tax=Pleuronectes platessa TaxID=8262 RepID=A0A9N7YY86_PLEPL|nr:unnamed protein product [Pleuronectes platessa]